MVDHGMYIFYHRRLVWHSFPGLVPFNKDVFYSCLSTPVEVEVMLTLNVSAPTNEWHVLSNALTLICSNEPNRNLTTNIGALFWFDLPIADRWNNGLVGWYAIRAYVRL